MIPSILDAVGNTPMVEIKKLNPNPAVRILAKMECLNPGGSIKDRPALFMIETGEKTGALTPDKTVIEATSGNTGIGLAMVCAVKGYRLLLVMSESASVERRKILKARGAEILLTPGRLGTDGAIEKVYQLCREKPDAYFMTDQFNNEANWRAHYEHTAPEIWEQTGGKTDVVVATIGTTGTVVGLSRKLKELSPDIRIIGVEPYRGHKIQGLKNLKEAYRPEIFDKDCLDEKIKIDDEDAFEMTRRLAREEGLFVGMSSGAAMFVAAKIAMSMKEGTVTTLFPDGGERYLSTPLFVEQTPSPIRVFNTLSKSMESFSPLEPGKVSMYSCGPTAHARTHIGECRRFVFSDMAARYFRLRGYETRHVMNITDYDDNTIAGADAAGMDLKAFADQNIERIMEDLRTLGIEEASAYPRASEHIDDMIALSEKLSRKGLAYEKLRSLYFDISRVSGYGRLSGMDTKKMRMGATVDMDDYEKDSPGDFTLFKRAKLSELKRGLFFPTEWGNVRPSWHIQCAAMSMKHLGETFDIHSGGRALVFPHHENVMAISSACSGNPLARFWLHCDRVLVRGKKAEEEMPGLTVPFLLDKGFSGRQIRRWLMSTHYRKPLSYREEGLKAAGRAIARIDRCVESLKNIPPDAPDPEPDSDQFAYDIKQGFINAMDDDFNISAAMAAVFGVVKRINIRVGEGRMGAGAAAKIIDALRKVDSVIGVIDFDKESADSEIRGLMDEREAARRRRDWETADRIRARLEEMGASVRDRKA
ncbi:cysteine synthase; cysteine--tRNA ligase [Candidatus Desulfarcum epimagneticum]|uniref:Cysteine--tRNA ligase n=1 Tax=uncultured Desulfobacteraceae bacterium TaxID=218296 RepID=A0A484HQ09_9BACT|nr:cysteine synthase; cysteine--tRNA ligase [uncultured Desulfobacteraceae bacterium]